MLPRITRTRPVLLLGDTCCHIFINNVNSPGFIRPLVTAIVSINDGGELTNNYLIADAISCFKNSWKQIKNYGNTGIDLVSFSVEFWDEKDQNPNSLLSVEVYAPSQWTANLFLEVLQTTMGKRNTISILNTYQIKGVDFPFNTINTLHYRFYDR